jgi:hypothetical protein
MKVLGKNYMHPRHLEVETGEKYLAWNARDGFYYKTSLCVAPNSELYAKLTKGKSQ